MTVYILVLLLVNGNTVEHKAAVFKSAVDCLHEATYNEQKYEKQYKQVKANCIETTLE